MTRKQQIANQLKLLIAKCDENIDSDIPEYNSDSSSDFLDKYEDDFEDVSAISDFSVHLSPPKKKQPTKKMVKERKVSKIPVRSKMKDNRQPPLVIPPPAIKPNPKPQEYFVERQTPQKPINFLAPDLNLYGYLTVCIYEGTGFRKPPIGERSTFVKLFMINGNDPIVTPTCWDHTNNAQYNFGTTINIVEEDCNQCSPYFEVLDVHPDNTLELLGKGNIMLHAARVEGSVCIMFKDDWVPIYSPFNRQPAGKVKMTMIFHNDEDISRFIKKQEPQQLMDTQDIAQQNPKQIYKESTAVQAEFPDTQTKDTIDDESSLFETTELTVPIGRKQKLWSAKWEETPSSTKRHTYQLPNPYEKKPDPYKATKERPVANIRGTPSRQNVHFIDDDALDDSDTPIPGPTGISFDFYSQEIKPNPISTAQQIPPKQPSMLGQSKPQESQRITPKKFYSYKWHD